MAMTELELTLIPLNTIKHIPYLSSLIAGMQDKQFVSKGQLQ
jgi:hypothetical protein